MLCNFASSKQNDIRIAQHNTKGHESISNTNTVGGAVVVARYHKRHQKERSINFIKRF